MVKNPPAMYKTWIQSLGWENPLEESMTTYSSILACRLPMPFPSLMFESEMWKWSLSVLSNSWRPMDCSPPGSSIHGIFQARVLEWGAIAFSAVRMDWLDLSAVQGTLKSFFQHHSSKHQFFSTQPSAQSNSHILTWPQEKSWPWLDGPLLAK